MQPRVEYSVTVPVSVDTAFQAFLDLERLLHRGVYEEATWVEGAPWQVGSRLRYVLVQPVRAIVSAVVTAISPPRAVSLLNHGLGITAEQHVSFGPDLHGGTRIRMTMELIGTSTELSEAAAHEAANFVTRDILDTIVARCRSYPSSATGS